MAQQEPGKDFFISYRSTDRVWAEWLAWQLEAAGYTTIIQAWDFHAGNNFGLKIHDALTQAQRVSRNVKPSGKFTGRCFVFCMSTLARVL